MPKVIGVRFRTSPRVYYFAPTEDEEYPKDTKVIVETQRGTEIATVVMPVTEVAEEKLVAPLKPIVGKASESEIEALAADEERKQEIIATAKQKVAERGLDMKVVDCEFTVDHSKLVLYFTAEKRVDFRELVRDLASAFRIRIDLRQIGARDECKLIGSLGACGLPCCCGRFDSDAEHVSIKMAKNQNLALTPNKINGMCGRLLCCLSYENKTYEDIIKRMPKHGAAVVCPDGRRGTVVSVTPLTEKVRVRVGDDENFEFCEFKLDELGLERREQKQDKPERQDNRSEKQGGQDRSANDRKPNGNNGNQRRGDRKFGKNGGNCNAAPSNKNDRARGDAETARDGVTDEPIPPAPRNNNNRNRHRKNKHKQNVKPTGNDAN